MDGTLMQRIGMAVGAVGLVLMGLGVVGLLDDDAPAEVATTDRADVGDPDAGPGEATDPGDEPSTEPADDQPVEDQAEPESTEAFIARFNDALEADDVDTLLALLHPKVFEVFDPEQCRTYLGGVTDSPPVTFRELVKVADWDWEVDGRTVTVPDAQFVEISREINGQTVIQETHYAYEGAELRWFTDCNA